MVSQKLIVPNRLGFHLRPAGELCKEALKYNSKVTFKLGDTTANAKSVLSVLAARVQCGSEIELICEGDDEDEAMMRLADLIKDGLGEESIYNKY